MAIAHSRLQTSGPQEVDRKMSGERQSAKLPSRKQATNTSKQQ